MTTTEQSQDRPPIEEMYVVHRAFRTRLPEIPRYIRSTPASDIARAAIIGDHLRLLLVGLELHHTGEDAVLWPRLLDRAHLSAELIETMQVQHENVHALTDHVEALSSSWQQDPSPVRGEKLARGIEALCDALFEHLDLEESDVLPLVLAHITAAEWKLLGESTKKARPADAAVLIGMLLDVCDEDERRMMLASLPTPIRLLAPTLGSALYRRHLRRVRAL